MSDDLSKQSFFPKGEIVSRQCKIMKDIRIRSTTEKFEIQDREDEDREEDTNGTEHDTLLIHPV